MHIAIDARTIFTGGGGDRTYFRSLIRHMAALSPQDRWTLYADNDDPDRETLRAPNVFVSPAMRAHVGALWNVTHLVPRLRRDRADLLHSQYTLPPAGPVPCPMVVTIHDATFRLFPAWFPRRPNLVQNLLIPRAARRAARVLTGSHSAATDIQATMNIPAARITVTPYGLDARFDTVSERVQGQVRSHHDLPPTYVLGVGLLRTRKNVAVVLEAMINLLVKGQWPEGCVLALTGSWSGAREAEALVRETPALAPHVRTLGYVPDADLPALYAGAIVSVYPSLYEGFGFPILESMACGCPVVSSDTSSLPEVAGDAAVLLPPGNVQCWADTLHRLLFDSDERMTRRKLGLAQAERFTWERTARETLAVYREATTQKL